MSSRKNTASALKAWFPQRRRTAFLRDPDLWHPWKCALVGIRFGASLIREQFDLLASLACDIDAVLVGSSAVLASRLVQEKLGRPLCSIVLQPWMIPSADAPPTMATWSVPRWAPKAARAMYFRALDKVGDWLLLRHLNPVRKSLDLPPVRRIFKWWNSPELILGLFPDWYGPPQSDWPAQMKLCGFPLYDGSSQASLDPELADFCGDANEAPIAFTFGTGMMHAARVFETGLEACKNIGRRALVLTRHSHQLPRPLPAFARHVEYAPFRHLFPRCAAVVHHGGIGTTAKCLETGTPQCILPFAFDQVDNGVRVQRLGAGSWLRQNKLSAKALAAKLEPLLSEEARARCSKISDRLGSNSAVMNATRALEAWAGTSVSRPLK